MVFFFALGQANSYQLIITSYSVLLVCCSHKPNLGNTFYNVLNVVEPLCPNVFSGGKKKGRRQDGDTY